MNTVKELFNRVPVFTTTKNTGRRGVRGGGRPGDYPPPLLYPSPPHPWCLEEKE